MWSWKQAFWLAKFELKYSKKNFLFHLAILVVLLLLIVPILPEYLENSSLGLDLFFLVIFSTIFHWARPKVFQIQKVQDWFWASPHLIMINQLPIPKKVIIRYRFLTYLIISIPFNILFLTSLYMLTPILQTNMSVSTYLVFSIVWLCFSIYIGCSQPVYEAGSNPYLNFAIALFLLGLLLFILIAIVFYKIYPDGFVHWTMFIALNWPILTVVISILLAVIGLNFWMNNMRRKMDKYDYLS